MERGIPLATSALMVPSRFLIWFLLALPARSSRVWIIGTPAPSMVQIWRDSMAISMALTLGLRRSLGAGLQ